MHALAEALAIVADDLVLAYGDEPVVTSLSLEVPRGAIVGIVGESGSGKSTVASAIAGFLPHLGGRIVSGRLTVNGVYRSSTPPRGAAAVIPPSTPGVAMILQDAMTSLDPVATVGRQVEAAIRSGRRMTRQQRARRAVELLGLVGFVSPERHVRLRPGQLSGGMRQRALIAIALAAEPDVLVADEPTSALDVKLASLTMGLLVDSARATGTTLVVIAHDLQLVAAYVDSIAVLRRGRLVEFGAAEQITSAPEQLYTRQLMACVPSLESYRQDHLVTVSAAEPVR